MKSVVIGISALVAAWAGLGEPASAAPGAPPHEVEAAAQSPLLSPVRHNSRHRRHRNPSPAERTAATREPAAPGAIKPGLWEFAAQLQTSAASPHQAGSQSPQREQPRIGGASKTIYTGCIAANKAAPAPSNPQCTLDDVQRNGPRITWSMTCTNPQNSVRSDGVAHYRGDTMEGTVISHLPSAGGAVSDVTQRITGRYLGPCTEAADGSPPAGSNAPMNPPSGGSAQWVEPPAASGDAKPSTSKAEAPSASAGERAATAARKRSTASPRRYTGSRRHAHHRQYSGGVWPWGRGFLPIPFLGGLF
jgi:hypothetical protein